MVTFLLCHIVIYDNFVLDKTIYLVVSAAAAAVVSAGAAAAVVSTVAGASTGATAAVSTGASSFVSPPPHEVNDAAIIAIAKNFFIVVFFWFKIIICQLIPQI